VYRDGVLIATVGSSTFEYEDHDRPKDVSTLYAVIAFDADGNESDQTTVIVE
jgi:hypothetical protein